MDENDLLNELYVASHPYYRDTITWCVQEQKPIPRWMGFFYMCTDPIVLVVGFLETILGVYVIYYLQQLEDVKWDTITIALAITCAILGQPIPFSPKSLPFRVFVTSCVLVRISIATFIVSFFFNVINEPPLRNQVASVKQIIAEKSPFQMVGDRFALEHLKRQNEVTILNNK